MSSFSPVWARAWFREGPRFVIGCSLLFYAINFILSVVDIALYVDVKSVVIAQLLDNILVFL